jgi:ABC-type nitrate/sulfonate/bicarbonate transport system permease component
LILVALAGAALWTIRRVADINGTRFDGVLTAALFGLWVLYFWQMLVVALEVPRVLLPAPSPAARSAQAASSPMAPKARATGNWAVPRGTWAPVMAMARASRP